MYIHVFECLSELSMYECGSGGMEIIIVLFNVL